MIHHTSCIADFIYLITTCDDDDDDDDDDNDDNNNVPKGSVIC